MHLESESHVFVFFFFLFFFLLLFCSLADAHFYIAVEEGRRNHLDYGRNIIFGLLRKKSKKNGDTQIVRTSVVNNIKKFHGHLAI